MTQPNPGASVVMRRMDALRKSIDETASQAEDHHLLDEVKWHYDNVLRALTKTFGLPR